MLVYIIRHGEAFNGSSTGLDRDRKLTELGHQQANAIGLHLQSCVPTGLRVIASPFIRAQETAMGICRELDQTLVSDDRLGADRGLSEMLSVVEEHREQDSIAIVSHMPTVGRFESLLTQGAGAPGSSFWTGEVVCVRVNDEELAGNGELIERYRLGS